MEIIFDCPNCQQELQVDAEAAGSEIECPTCSESITIPQPEDAKSTADTDSSDSPSSSGKSEDPQPPAHSGSIAASAAAKEVKHFSVPQHKEPAESLIQKPNKPLEAAAKDTDKTIRVKTIRHTDCVEVGKDRYDDIVGEFLRNVGQENIISISPITYTHLDMASRQVLSEYGVTIIYIG